MAKAVFTGCSFTAGTGWDTSDHPDFWINLCCSQLEPLKDLEIVNLGQSTASNAEIFKNSVAAIVDHGADIAVMFCQWTSMPRYSFDVGFELWPTHTGITKEARYSHNVILNHGVEWTRSQLDQLLDPVLTLHHLHREITQVVQYASILTGLAQKFGLRLYHINGQCPWDRDYFVRLPAVLPDEYTPFTKKDILKIESREDADVFKLYTVLHDDYDQAGGVDPAQWVNLYDSMSRNLLDHNQDPQQPGVKSNQLYFRWVKKCLERC